MDKENVVCMHSGILFNHKKNKIQSFAGTWLEQEDIMLSEISHVQKDEYNTTHFHLYIEANVDLKEIQIE